MPHEEHDGRITLRIESSAGGVIEKQYNVNEPIKAVKTSAMAGLHIDPATQGNYRLMLDGQQLPEDRTLAEAGVPNGATLILAPIRAEVI